MDNRIHDAFTTVTASERLKTSTKNHLREAREKRSVQRISPFARRLVCTACAVSAVALGAGIYHGISQTPVSYISIDVNNSIELSLNRWDTVIQASPYNEDSAEILEGVSVKGMAYTDAVELIVESKAMQPSSDDTSALTITVASDSAKKEEKIKSGIEHCAGYQNYGGRSCTSNVELIDEAHGNGMSFGKYAAYLLLSQYDSKITLDECRKMKMAEINELISRHENSEKHDKPDAAGKDEPKAPKGDKLHGDPAKNAPPDIGTKPVPPDAREIPHPDERPGVAKDARLPHEERVHQKHNNPPDAGDEKKGKKDSDSGPEAPPSPREVAPPEKAEPKKPAVPPHNPSTDAEESKPHKDEKGQSISTPETKDEQPAAPKHGVQSDENTETVKP